MTKLLIQPFYLLGTSLVGTIALGTPLAIAQEPALRSQVLAEAPAIAAEQTTAKAPPALAVSSALPTPASERPSTVAADLAIVEPTPTSLTTTEPGKIAGATTLPLTEPSSVLPASVTNASRFLEASSLEIAQVRPASNGVSGPPVPSFPAPLANPRPAESGVPSASPAPTEPPTTTQQAERWHFLFQPYLYIPVTIYGSSTFQSSRLDRSRDFAVDANQIRTALRNNLDFVFFGNLQAWTPNYHLGILTNLDYLSTTTDRTLIRPIRLRGTDNFIPTQLNATVDTRLLSIDLTAAYRFYNQSQVNPKGVATEFDLGPLVFDVIGGLNITSLTSNLDLTSARGGEVNFDRNKTVVSPVLGARLRLNVSPTLALVTVGSVSGFGISGLTQWGVLGGIDWMFSGNTSLGLGYRFGNVSYNRDLNNGVFGSGRNFGLDVSNNGPYLSFSFRF